MKTIRANDGGELLNAEQFAYTKDELKRPVLNFIGTQPAPTGTLMVDGSATMTGDLQMGGNAIFGVNSISNTDEDLAIESNVSMNNHKIGELADPVADQDAVTKKYADTSYLSLGGGTLGDMAEIRTDNLMTLTADDKADVTLTDAGFVFVSGENGVNITSGNTSVNINTSDIKVDGELNMQEHAITNAQKISTNGTAPLYIGATIEASGTNAPRLTATTAGEAAFVKADTQSTYVPVYVGEPTNVGHATNKGYVDNKLAGMLPPFTAEDNGKILVIKDGKLAWGTINDVDASALL